LAFVHCRLEIKKEQKLRQDAEEEKKYDVLVVEKERDEAVNTAKELEKALRKSQVVHYAVHATLRTTNTTSLLIFHVRLPS